MGWLRDKARCDKVAFAAGRFGGAEIGRIDFVSSLNLQRSQNTPWRKAQAGARNLRERPRYFFITMKTDGLFPMLHSVMTNKTVFSEGLRSSVCYQMHAWCDKKGSSGYIEDPVLHARVAAFFLERAGLEDGCTLYIDRVACELNPSYRHSQARRDNLAKLRPQGLTGEPAAIYDGRQRDAEGK